MKSRIKLAVVLTVAVVVLGLLGSTVLWFPDALAGEELGSVLRMDPEAVKWGYLSAALATGLSSLGAAYAVATVGSAAMGSLVEKPELFGRLLIFIGLAEGIAIYGLIVSILILNQLA